jgi:pyridoxamine 5'-phosphate oxidase
MPRSRIAILRGVDEGAQAIRFHTDLRSEKVAELKADPRCSILVYAPDLKLQARFEGQAVLNNQDALATRFWQASQVMSRKCYGTSPSPGSQIDDGSAFALPENDDEIAAGFANFVAVTLAVEQLEWLYLRSDGHLRGLHDLKLGTERWLVP